MGAKKTESLDSAQPQSIVIPPGHNQLEIDYTALNFSAPDDVRFKYRLEGRETAWTTPATRASRITTNCFRDNIAFTSSPATKTDFGMKPAPRSK